MLRGSPFQKTPIGREHRAIVAHRVTTQPGRVALPGRPTVSRETVSATVSTPP